MPTPAHLALTPQIDEFRREFERLADEADALVAPLSDEQFYWPPAEASWSVAQCIDHLNVTARLYLPQLDEGIANAIRQGLYGEGPFKYWWFARLFVRLLEPPPKMRVKTPSVFQPPPARTRREIMAAFRAYQVQYVDRLRQANGLDLARARPLAGRVVDPGPARDGIHGDDGARAAAPVAGAARPRGTRLPQ